MAVFQSVCMPKGRIDKAVGVTTFVFCGNSLLIFFQPQPQDGPEFLKIRAQMLLSTAHKSFVSYKTTGTCQGAIWTPCLLKMPV